SSNIADKMIGRNNLFKAERIEQLTLVPIELTHHGIAPSRIAIPRRNHCSQAPSTTFATKSATTGLMRCSKTAFLFDHLVGGREQRWWHGETEHPCRRVIDDELELGGLHDRQICRFCTLEDATGIDTD